MSKEEEIRSAHQRMYKVFSNRPESAFSTNYATAVVEDGLRCAFEQDGHKAVMDMPSIMGGDDAGPTPGFFGRAGVAGCVSIGLKQLAVSEGMTFDKITVDIETDFDDGASMGLGENSAAPLETRISITVATNEPLETVQDLVARLLEHDPWFLALRDAQLVKTTVATGE